MSTSTFFAIPSIRVCSSPKRSGCSCRSTTIIAVHLFAMRASEAREGQLAENTVHVLDIRRSFRVTLK
ncbi:hypothetical protein GCM10010213_29170 [Microbacterium maritypicum]|nr:hypothetical protein GCM10010213_29170 [Microbacterium liquefaciens]